MKRSVGWSVAAGLLLVAATISPAASGAAAIASPVRVVVHPGPTGGVNLKHLVTDAALRALARLPHHGQVTIDVRPDARATIPHVGVGGETDRQGNLHIEWDPRGAVRRNLLTWIPEAVAHELDHSSRIRDGAGYDPTLGGQIVAEGLADHFARQVFPHTPQMPWDHALSKSLERAYWKTVQPRLGEPDTDRLFWGGLNRAFPVWAGYSLGYTIVGRYLTAHHLNGSQAVNVPASKILSSFHGG